jgi:pimeloyl-ACP methyl ester carboxylesterase
MQVKLDDAVLYVRSEGTGNAIVLLHGFPLTHRIWDVQFSALARTHRVLAPDLRAMGSSSGDGGPILMETHAGDIAAILDACGIEQATIVGHSLGGYVALAFARLFTERVERLVLVCSRAAADDERTARARFEAAYALERDGDIEPLVETYVRRLLAPQTLAHRPDIVELTRGIARANAPRGLAAVLRGIAMRPDSRDLLPDLTMPVAVVAGRHDAVVPLAEAHAMAEALPNGRLEILDETGHLPQLEESERLSELLVEICRSAA